jgi:two-component sensor histidine kinase
MTGAGITALMEQVITATATPRPLRLQLTGAAGSVPDARRFVRDTLAGCPRADDLAQAVTELAANAIAWSAAGEGGTFTVTIRRAPRWARVEVTDPGPALLPAATGNGWGLGIVAMVTDRSGATYGPGSQRTAWAEATWHAGPAQGQS